MNQREFDFNKKKYSGFYNQFNNKVTKWHVWKVFDYDTINKDIWKFKTMEEFINFHIKNKQEIFNQHLDLMVYEAKNKGLTVDYKIAKDCFLLRLGNIYEGAMAEYRILDTLSDLKPWITCEKTSKEFDTNYKVDGIVTLVGIDQIGVQIKPFSFTFYGVGSEDTAHKQFLKEFGIKIYYIFYKDLNTIVFDGEQMLLTDVEKISTTVEKLVTVH